MTDAAEFLGDGTTYSRALGWKSPEGNFYGQTRFVREWAHPVVWQGEKYIDVEIAGVAESVSALPATTRPFMEIWSVVRTDGTLDLYYQDDDRWKLLQWLWTVSGGMAALRYPGVFIGACHVVVEEDVLVYWDGFQWRRLRHSILDNDEPQLHLPPGFLQLFTPDVLIRWVSKRELALEPAEGGSGTVLVNGHLVAASTLCSVLSRCPVLAWNDVTRTVYPTYVEPGTEYWIYLANRATAAFNVAALPGDETHNATQEWDFRGRLFLSLKDPENNYLDLEGIGIHAMLAGKIQTDNTPASAGGPFFLRELDISLISRGPSFSEAFRELSDFYVAFVDQDTLELRRIDGSYGNIYIPDGLVYLREGGLIYRDDPVVEIEDDGTPMLVTSPSRADRLWFLYIANSMDAFNFNAVNEDTGRPWQPADEDALGNYDAALDYRRRPFMSSQQPDHGRISETYPGFYSRWIGQVTTDANGRFINASDLSVIRQPVFNPAYLDGLAEIQIQPVATTEFRIARAKGTSGIVLVRGQAVQTYESTSDSVFKMRTTDTVYDYDENTISAPLVADDTVEDHPSELLYVYLPNGTQCWGALAGKAFWSTVAPTSGYLSRNWPGNNARWICTVAVDADGEFSGSYIVDALAMTAPQIDDFSVSTNSVWSSARITQEINRLWAAVNLGALWESQKSYGLQVRLDYVDATTIKLIPTGESVMVVFPDTESTLDMPSAGISHEVSGSAGVFYYVYLSASGDLIISTDEPTAASSKLMVNGNTILVGCLCLTGTDAMSGNWNVCSWFNEPTRQWTLPLPTSAETSITVSGLPGLVAAANADAVISRTGQTIGYAELHIPQKPGTSCTCIATVGNVSCTAEVVLDSHWTYRNNVYVASALNHVSVSGGFVSLVQFTEVLTGDQPIYYDGEYYGEMPEWWEGLYLWRRINARSGEIVVQRGMV